MGTSIILQRDPHPPEGKISLDEWTRIVGSSGTVRLRTEAYISVNPVTNELIRVNPGEGATELELDGSWIPFLTWKRGRLIGEYHPRMENPSDPVRSALVRIAVAMKASIHTDADDAPLPW